MKKLIATLILSIPIVTGCLDGPIIYFENDLQRSTVIPGHPECIAVRPANDFVWDFYTEAEYAALGWDFTVENTGNFSRGYYMKWTRHGAVAGFSATADSTVWGSLHCSYL